MIAPISLASSASSALEVVGELPQLLVLGLELLALEAGQPAEPHVEDGLRLTRGEGDELPRVRGVDLLLGAAGALEEAAEPGQSARRSAAPSRSSVSFDDRMISMTRSMLMTARPRPSTISRRARASRRSNSVRRVTTSRRCSTNTWSARAQRQQHRAAVDDREHVDRERRLQRGVLEEVVEDDLVVGVALELEHDAHAGAVGLVADVGDALEPLVAHHRRRSASIQRALFTMYGSSVTMIAWRSLRTSSTLATPRTMIEPRPVL